MPCRFCHAPSGEVRIFVEAEETGHATTPTPTQSASAAAWNVATITGCHLHDTDLLCLADGTEYRVHTTVTATATQDVPPSFTGCHADGAEMYVTHIPACIFCSAH